MIELGHFKGKITEKFNRELTFLTKLFRRDPHPLSNQEREDLIIRRAWQDWARTPEGQIAAAHEITSLMGLDNQPRHPN